MLTTNKENGFYSYADFLSRDESFRAEIIDGEVFPVRAPEPDSGRKPHP